MAGSVVTNNEKNQEQSKWSDVKDSVQDPGPQSQDGSDASTRSTFTNQHLRCLWYASGTLLRESIEYIVDPIHKRYEITTPSSLMLNRPPNSPAFMSRF